jgi:DNA-directed RNA polymerase subunit beta'
MKYKGITREVLGRDALARRRDVCHIELARRLPTCSSSLPSRIGLLLDMTLKDLERILYFDTTSCSSRARPRSRCAAS